MVTMILKYWKTILLMIFILVIFLLGKSWLNARRDNVRMGRNQETLLSQVQYFKLKDSSNVASMGALSLSVSEFKQASTRQMQDLQAMIQEMNLKVRNIKSISSASTVTTNDINTFFKDSVLINQVRIHYLDTITPFYDIKIKHFIVNDSLAIRIIYRDKMTQIVYLEKRGMKFWTAEFWGKRKAHQVINFANPDTQIQYPQYIEITKNNKK